jgi:hypothetical protein
VKAGKMDVPECIKTIDFFGTVYINGCNSAILSTTVGKNGEIGDFTDMHAVDIK